MLNPFTRVNYVAAEQTMKSSWMSRLFLLAGGLTVRRTWNENSKEQRAGLDPSDTRKIERSLKITGSLPFPRERQRLMRRREKGLRLL
ncbi:hypothetical protein LWM68_28430 [Niabella sp. W65]|nr:hypothetical protein [Niabella sp. W65]MCH7366355.1 hypothetical protein [Niabella sp. W65]ULT42075.1 hypothetical protein KRR40_47380 [Niabella sp. I65]